MPSNTKTAEQRFRDAFNRLKENRPEVVPRGTPVSQNNIANEAGTDSTALRKKRYPALIRDIQTWIEINSHAKEVQHKRLALRRKKEDAKTECETLKTQRDFAQTQLVSAHRLILELNQENALLQTRLNDLLPPPTPLFR